MSESSIESPSGLVDEAGRRIAKRDTVEPLVAYMQERPVCTALAALALGFLLGKIL
jgi:hypothetical protein